MIIQSGNLEMNSNRKFQSHRSTDMKIESGSGKSFLESLQGPIFNLEDGKSYCLDPDQTGEEELPVTYNKMGLLSDPYTDYGNKAANKRDGSSILRGWGEEDTGIGSGLNSGGVSSLGSISDGSDFSKQALTIQFKSLNFLFRLFFGKQIAGESLDLGSYLGATGGRYQSYTVTETYQESETTTFNTTGTVVTADGRELNFNLNVGMSREFYQQSSVSYLRENNPLIDPLLIHLDDNIDAVSDQTFYFDIDADGQEDEISQLAPGSGFLALDKNGDGQINDGSELFGAATGDGFGELAEYDLDGNGWIDEADEVFDKLRVWSADSNGNMRLCTLKESNVGAICLQSAPTKFSVNNENNDTKAVVRATGFFLREDTGAAGVMQQVDFAKRMAS